MEETNPASAQVVTSKSLTLEKKLSEAKKESPVVGDDDKKTERRPLELAAPALHLAMSLARVPHGMKDLKLTKDHVEKLLASNLRVVVDNGLAQAFRSLLNPGHVYKFKIPRAGLDTTISSNVAAGNNNFDPSGTAEWSTFQALFDEYRVNELVVEYFPLIQSGASTQWFPPLLSVASDWDSQVTPTSHVQCRQYADGDSHYVPLQSASAYFVSPLNRKIEHKSKIPSLVAVAGSVASVSWLDTSQAWPGGQMFYSDVIGTNGTTVFHRLLTYFVSFRVRK